MLSSSLPGTMTVPWLPLTEAAPGVPAIAASVCRQRRTRPTDAVSFSRCLDRIPDSRLMSLPQPQDDILRERRAGCEKQPGKH